MLEKRTVIDVQEAINRCIIYATEMPTTEVELEKSLGYYLAEDIIASYDIPMFDKSPYDGYAVRSAATAGASGDNRVAFKSIDHIGAGSVSDKTLSHNEAVRIMTGAPIPSGADAVVMLEQTVATEEGFTLRKSFTSGENISKQGEECKKGDVILTSGTLITPGVIAVLATFSYQQVAVRKRPSVALIATGSELAEADAELTPGKIRNSNGPMIAGLLNEMHIQTESYRVTEDHFEHLLSIVQQALSKHDIVITTGGVSVGDFDFMPAIYKAIEADVLFNKVAMRPGSVTTVAVKDEQMLFGLSGNPSACYSGFELFTKPVIKKMLGAKHVHAPVMEAELSEDFTKANPFTRFIRAELDIVNRTVRPAGFNKSNAVVAIAKSNSMIILPGGTRGFQNGDTVKVMLTRLTDQGQSW
ncbi:molybdopterin molybdenumtransferase MoeA [Macrococcus hajekii]|uniref:Molybdopterin molybdenumtransferase n=1 Tax=Macrococcus hajekii TaxID=198482 RepID=A0A4R6BK55_9STAP|nr:gephyrin-like molybdotransferase Glp [Macrococcus hajekii]TDM02112.1 molybdopterin molybdenumtransferase MoeA [Macrococcus hajekii]GGB08365.1 molybdopterin molybdenumtransferase [Macrococcus hajekii]